MFAKFSLVTLILPLVQALTIQTPTGLTSGGQTTINWTTTAGDPTSFSFELLNQVFNNAYAIANNVATSLGTLTLDIPIVPPGDGYTLEAVNIGNINDVFASTGPFSIGPATTTSSAPPSTTSIAPGSAGASTPTTPAVTTTTPGFGTTVAGPLTTAVATGTDDSGTAAPTVTAFNAAMGVKASNIASVAALALGAVAGAFIVVL